MLGGGGLLLLFLKLLEQTPRTGLSLSWQWPEELLCSSASLTAHPVSSCMNASKHRHSFLWWGYSLTLIFDVPKLVMFKANFWMLWKCFGLHCNRTGSSSTESTASLVGDHLLSMPMMDYPKIKKRERGFKQ